MDSGVDWPWSTASKDTQLGDEYNCLEWYTDKPDGECWYEWQCQSYDKGCACQYSQQPVLLLRGLCQGNTLDTQYTPRQLAGAPDDVFLVGQVTTQIHYNDSSEQWMMTDAASSVRAESRATKVSYVLGKHKWTVTGDVFACHEGQPYTTLLKLSGCNPEGEFTCTDGQCVTMEQRCDQIPDCRDESDEENCRILVLKKSYNKEIAPFTVNSTDRSIVPVQLNISINLLKIVNMNEEDHKMDLQFEITMGWRENSRTVFHNLKKDKSLNALSNNEVTSVWLPLVIYDNTDQKELTRLGMDWEWNSPTKGRHPEKNIFKDLFNFQMTFSTLL